MRSMLPVVAAAALTAGTLAAAAEERAIIVLDASGSMWGQIDGTPRIAIARDVLAEVLGQTSRDIYLGLLAYGHREKGSCEDIELLIAPAPGAAAEIVGMARDINPKGKTPLSEAVRRAAEELRYGEERATVILITDGLETCNADPCALARELESGGVDFTAHVVGFGLSPEEGRQVACLADETGGKYIQAGNAEELVDAIAETVAEVAEPPPEEVPPPEEAPAVLPAASLEAPDSVAIGERFDVVWEGPGELRDHIYLVDPAGNNGEGRDLRGVRLTNADFDNRRVGLIAPVTVGSYLIQYRHGGAQRAVLAERPITVVEAEVSLSAPASGDIGSTVTVDWVGPGNVRDSIELFDPEAKQGEGAVLHTRRVRTEDFENRKVRIILPTEPGFYELRYWNGDDRKVLATRQIEVLAAEVSLSAPDSVDMGRSFDVIWVGPGATRDSIQFFDPEAKNGEGRVVSSIRVRNGDFDNRTVRLTAPNEAGTYKLRYHNGDSNAVLATRPIVVTATEVSITGPASVEMGRTFEVSWVGPGGNRDHAQIYDPDGNNGNGRVVYERRFANEDFDNRKARLIAPVEPGEYVLRYWDGQGRKPLAASPIAVVATEVTITAPDTVKASENFVVSWVGPGAARDAIDVMNGDRRAASSRLSNGDYNAQTVKIKAPKEPGSYTLRYYNGDFDTVLATRPITVE